MCTFKHSYQLRKPDYYQSCLMTNTNYYETNEPLQQYGQVFFLSVSLAINIKFVIQWNSHTQRDKTEYMQANQSPPTPYSESLNL